MKYLINNIQFTFEEGAIEFTYTESFNNNSQGRAFLQLPDTADSQHSIDDVDYDSENEAHTEIFQQLSDYFYNDYKDSDCAAASAEVGEHINHVEEVIYEYEYTDDHDNARIQRTACYIAFSDSDTFLLVESPYRSHNQLSSLFTSHIGDTELLSHESEIRKIAVDQYHERLKTELTAEMQKCFDSVTDTSNTSVLSARDVDYIFDEVLHDFMKSKFGDDYADHETAQEFYQMQACDIRVDYERKLIDWMTDNANSSPRIILD